MLLPTGSSVPSTSTEWFSRQAVVQTSSSNAWSSSEIAAVTLGIILGIIVVGVLLCFALYKVDRFIRDLVSGEVEAAVNKLELGRGRSNDQRSDPSSRPAPNLSDPLTPQDTSPADVVPPSDEDWRHPAFEHLFPTLRIISPRTPSPLSRSPERFQYEYPPSIYGAPQSSYERERPRQCSIADLPTILPQRSAHCSNSPPPPSLQLEGHPRARNVGELRAGNNGASSRSSDYPRRGPRSSWYSTSRRRAPPPISPPSPEMERERCQRQGQTQPPDNYLPAVVRRVSSRHFSSSRRRTSYVPPYVASDSSSDRGNAEGSRR